MNKALQGGGWTRAKETVVFAAVLLLSLGTISAARAQAKPADMSQSPATASAPAMPPASAPQPAPPATPSLMPAVPGTPLDRIVAIVNDDLILDSDVNEETRFERFDPYRDPQQKTSRDDVIERLINRALILQQLKLQPEDAPSDAKVNKEIDQLRKNIPACNAYDCETKAGWDRFLADQGFSEASFFAHWKERMTVLSFIEERFQMGINVTQAQIESYYEKTLLPEYERQHAPAPKVQAIASEIREILMQQQIGNLLQDWLKSLRAQGSVVVLHPGEEAP